MDTLESNWLALNLIPNLGVKTLQELLKHFGSIENLIHTSSEEIVQKSGISLKLANRISRAKEVSSYQIEKRLIQEYDVQLICLESSRYPKILKEISSPPPILYWQGSWTAFDSPCLSIVGSRSCTSYGKKHTRRLIFELAELIPDIVIVSGLARGIDTIAHQAALEAGLSTIAVLAGGLKSIYPPENQPLAEAIKKQGALITEFPMGLKPLARNFPIRNRIISGLSQGTVVVEAGQKSGALITAAFGLQHNREVFALPGNVDSSASRGSNQLISRHHAKLIVHAKDIVEELYLTNTKLRQTQLSFDTLQQQTLKLSDFSQHKATIIKELSGGLKDIDTLYSETTIEMNKLLGILVELELEGYLHSLEGQRYQLDEKFKIEEGP